jgi:hypothetical protein
MGLFQIILAFALACSPIVCSHIAMAEATSSDNGLQPYLWFCQGKEKPAGLILGSGLIVYDMRNDCFRNDLVPKSNCAESSDDVRAVVLIEEGDTSFAGQYSNGWTKAGIRSLDLTLFSVKSGVHYATENILGSDPPETINSTSEPWVYGDWPTEELIQETVNKLAQQMEDINMEPDSKAPWEYEILSKEDAENCLSDYQYTEEGALQYIPKDPGVVITGYQGYCGKSLTVPDEMNGQPVVAIGNGVFSGSKCSVIILPKTLTRIGEEAFRDSAVTQLALPVGITVLPYGTFLNCRLQTLDLPGNLKAIAYEAFSGCMDLKSLALPENLAFIGDGAFEGCSSLEEMNIPIAVENIGNLTFSECSGLRLKIKQNSYAQWYLEKGAAQRNEGLKEQGIENFVPPFDIIP